MKTKAIIGVALALPLMAAAADKLISYDSEKMKAYAPSTNDAAKRAAVFAIDGSGLDANGSHTTTPDKNMWMSSNTTPGWFLVDLGQAYNLSKIHIWNYNHSSYAYRGVKKLDVYVTTADSVTKTSFDPHVESEGWQLAKAEVVLQQAPGNATPYTGEDVAFAQAKKARWVAFKFSEYYNAKEKYAGLSEIQFYEEGATATFTAAYSDVADSTRTSAILRGTLYLPGAIDSADVWAVWGKETGGSTLDSWSSKQKVGTLAAGEFTVELTDGLEANTEYKFAFCAENPDASLSFSETASFLTYESENCVWTGAAEDGRWATDGNWSTCLAPKFVDTVTIPNAATGTITVDQEVVIAALDFTGAEVTLAGSGSITTSTVRLGSVADDGGRTSVMSVKIVPVAQQGTETFVFDIGTNRTLNSAGAITSSTQGLKIRKTGAGTLNRTVAVTEGTDSPFEGTWLVEEGFVTTSAKGAIRGSIKIGGAGKSAVVQVSEDGFSNGTSAEVLERGELRTGKIAMNGTAYRLDPLVVHDGGTVVTTGSLAFKNVNLYGATISGDGNNAVLTRAGNNNSCMIESKRADKTSIIDVTLTSGGTSYSWYLKAARGSAPVDMLVVRPIKEGNVAGNLWLSGGGVIKLTASMPDLKQRLLIGDVSNKSRVDCFVDGASMASGKNTTYVRYGSTLAGTGTLANTAGVAFSVDGTAVTVNDDANAPAGSLCTIAPGSINGETGDHVFGTMTIGAEDFSRAVKFNTNGRLLCHIGENRASDKLMVYGTVKVTGEGNQIEVVVPEDLKRARTGKYTLLEARDGIVDAEGNAVAEPFAFTCANKKVTFGVEKNAEGKIVKIYANVPPQGLAVIVR